MKKILIIGKRSFLAKNLYKNLNKKFNSKLIKFNQLNNVKKNINKFDYIINCSINKTNRIAGTLCPVYPCLLHIMVLIPHPVGPKSDNVDNLKRMYTP